MRARGWRTVVAGSALAMLASACGGSGGEGDGSPSLLPLLAADELVSLRSPDTTSNEFKLCSSGDRVYVAWVERSSVVPDAVYFNRSLDGGVTWLPDPVPVSDATTNPGQVAICCEGDRVYLAYEGSLGGSTSIRLNRSLDAGTTFLPAEITVSDEALQDVDRPAIDCDGLTVHVA